MIVDGKEITPPQSSGGLPDKWINEEHRNIGDNELLVVLELIEHCHGICGRYASKENLDKFKHCPDCR
jgi:hypothetical protein